MDDRILRTISSLSSLEQLKQFEANARARGSLDQEIEIALRTRGAFLCRREVSEKTGLPLTNLSPAEEKIVHAVSEYLSIKRRQGSNAGRTLRQVEARGLIGAAEESVCKSKPTQGFTTLTEADLEGLSYEQIVLDHPDEFSARALWYARRTLGLSNEMDRPPSTINQVHTALVEERSGSGRNPPWSRDELILALDLYLRLRGVSFSHTTPEIIELSDLLNRVEAGRTSTNYRNVNGVYMKMMNFRRFDPEFISDGKVGLSRGNKEEERVWSEFADDRPSLRAAVAEIRARIIAPTP